MDATLPDDVDEFKEQQCNVKYTRAREQHHRADQTIYVHINSTYIHQITRRADKKKEGA